MAASSWSRLQRTGLPALLVLLPSFIWLALTCAVLQAFLVPAFWAGFRKEYYTMTGKLFEVMHRPLVFLFQYSGSKVYLYGKGIQKDVLEKIGYGQSIILVNHRGNLDWLVGLLILDVGGGMKSCKAMIKRDLLAVPFFGFMWWAADFICLRRNWAADESTLAQCYKGQHAYRECQVPYALTMFPEGTRLTPDKLKDSQAFCKSRGLPVFQHVLCPRTKGLFSAMSGMRLDSVYDATVTPSGGDEANIVTLAQGLPCELRIHMERLDPASAPSEEEAFGKWLQGRWAAKEHRLERYAAEGAAVLEGEPSEPVLGGVRASVAATTLGAIVWYLTCAFCFASWCIRHGRLIMLACTTCIFVVALAALGAVLHAVHFKKSKHGKKSK